MGVILGLYSATKAYFMFTPNAFSADKLFSASKNLGKNFSFMEQLARKQQASSMVM
jgi:hypothetical protein